LMASIASSRLTITALSPGSSDSRSPKASISAVSASVRWGCACMFIALASLGPISRGFADHTGITVGLEIERQRLVARLDDLAPVEHVHAIRHDTLEQALVVGDDDDRAVRRTQRVDAVRDDLQRVDIEAGIGLVEHAELRLQKLHLQDLGALLLAAGEADIERPLQHVH